MDTAADGARPSITVYTSAICGYCVAAKNFLRSRGLALTLATYDHRLATAAVSEGFALADC